MDNKIKLLSLFSGIGAFEKALENLGVDYELVGFSEIDKWAIESYSAIHNISTDLNLGDISEIKNEDLPKADLVTYGFPCQDVSIAGKLKGIKEGTRSGLLYEAERVIEQTKPKYAIAENVKNLIGKRFKDDFEALLERLEDLGYNNYWEVLNAKDFNIPQNRERVFIISIRKDIDNNKFEFPEPFELELRLKDMLEDKVEDKYYIDNERANELIERLKDGKKGSYPNVEDGPKVTSALGSREHRGSGWNDVVGTLCARDYKDPKVIAEPIIVASRGRNPENTSDRTVGNPTAQRLEPNSQGIANTLTTVQKDNLVLEPKRLGGLFDSEGRKRQAGAVWDKECIAPTLDTCQGGYREPSVIVREATKKGYAIATVGDSINLEQPNSKTRRGRVGKEVAQTLTTSCNQATLEHDYKIRKLTPKECWRLMGFEDNDYWTARRRLEEVFYNGKDRSNSQMYKQAGNSIVVNVLEEIFRNLLLEK